MIELIIVVAIIAILAGIAVPNYSKAQMRSKVASVKGDLRIVATAIESYMVDWEKAPYDGYVSSGFGLPGYNFWYLPKSLSTPVGYLTTCNVQDPFRIDHPFAVVTPETWQADNIRYTSVGSTWGTDWNGVGKPIDATNSTFFDELTQEFGAWRLSSAGPDRSYGPNGWQGISGYPAASLPLPYDPSNGTVSDGDIIRTQVSPDGYLNTY